MREFYKVYGNVVYEFCDEIGISSFERSSPWSSFPESIDFFIMSV